MISKGYLLINSGPKSYFRSKYFDCERYKTVSMVFFIEFNLILATKNSNIILDSKRCNHVRQPSIIMYFR